ncbi:MAG: hypothetical protein V1701_05670 [Planctomycetota bacterium]
MILFVDHAVLMWGKLRRMWFIYLRPEKTQYLLSHREGECQRCGACCKIAFECPALDYDVDKTVCKYYERRTDICKLFPLNERDLKDRDIIMPHIKCGFRFNGNGGNGDHPK